MVASPSSDRLRLHRRLPTQLTIQACLVDEALNVLDALVAIAVEHSPRQVRIAVRVIELSDALLRRPARTKRGHEPRDLVAVHAITPRIGAAALGVAHAAPGHDGPHYIADLPHAQVVLIPPDVERLIVDDFARCLEHGEKRACDVFRVHQRTPRRAVTLDERPARGVW